MSDMSNIDSEEINEYQSKIYFKEFPDPNFILKEKSIKNSGIDLHPKIFNNVFSDSQNKNFNAKEKNSGRRFLCEICHKIFKEKGNLKTHMRIHTGERPFSCPFEGCSQAFRTSGQLYEHNKTHFNIKPYKCEYCKGSFSRLSTLKTHLKSNFHSKDISYFENSINFKTHKNSQYRNNNFSNNELQIQSMKEIYIPSLKNNNPDT